MLNNDLNKEWKINFFKIFSSQSDNPKSMEKADKEKFEHFPPVIGNFYGELLTEESLKKVCDGHLRLKKAKLDENYDDEIVKIDYEKSIKTQLNKLMNEQIIKLNQEDPTFLTQEEKEVIMGADFPFIKLMTLVYTKDTDQMTPEDQEEWKNQMNNFISQQIVFGVINTYYTMKLYQDNNYVRSFQTPYNKQEIWNKYADNNRGFCVTYDFKQIKTEVAKNLAKLYPVLYVDKKLEEKDLDYDVNNISAPSLLKIDSNPSEYDNEWMYIHNHHFTETEYLMLDNLLEPVYTKSINDESIQNILTNMYLNEDDENNLEYDYKEIIFDVLMVLESDEFQDKIGDEFDEVLKITDDFMEIEFMKPEAVYLGTNFPEEKIDEYKEIISSKGIRIFQIKEKEGKLFKALI